MFSYVKSHLPEVTIKTHLSARANVFIRDSTVKSLHLLICGFTAIIKVQGVPGNDAPSLQRRAVIFLSDFNTNVVIQARALVPLRVTPILAAHARQLSRLNQFFKNTRSRRHKDNFNVFPQKT